MPIKQNTKQRVITMEHYEKQAAIHFDLYQAALDNNDSKAAEKHMKEWENYQEMIKQVK